VLFLSLIVQERLGLVGVRVRVRVEVRVRVRLPWSLWEILLLYMFIIGAR
jgi:hypothetical protein